MLKQQRISIKELAAIKNLEEVIDNKLREIKELDEETSAELREDGLSPGDYSVDVSSSEVIETPSCYYETENGHVIGLNIYLPPPANLPESISKLTKLRSLIIESSGSHPRTIPDSIGNLSELEYFSLHGYKITKLPDSITTLEKLRNMNVINTDLKELPESIGNLTNLIKLNLRNNLLTSLPESIGNLTNLIKLNLRNNLLTSLPESIGNLGSLRELTLSRSSSKTKNEPGLTDLPETLLNLDLDVFSANGHPLNQKAKDIQKTIHKVTFNRGPKLSNLLKIHGIEEKCNEIEIEALHPNNDRKPKTNLMWLFAESDTVVIQKVIPKKK